jgi:hypothetical protein
MSQRAWEAQDLSLVKSLIMKEHPAAAASRAHSCGRKKRIMTEEKNAQLEIQTLHTTAAYFLQSRYFL